MKIKNSRVQLPEHFYLTQDIICNVREYTTFTAELGEASKCPFELTQKIF
jgi:hypothetical protein